MSSQSVDLLKRIESGDTAAEAELFDRYVGRLIALASSRLSGAMRRRLDAEDIVQSAYRSFFRGAQQNKFEIQKPGQLWGLLAAITVNKVRDQAKYHTAQKRTLSAEQSMTSSRSCYGLAPVNFAGEPTTDEVVALEEQLKTILEKLPDQKREVFEMYLQNHSPEMIASAIRRSLRTVRRTIDEIRIELENELNL